MKFTALLVSIALLTTAFVWKTDHPDAPKKRVVIDAGHGGKDNGQSVGDVYEKDLVFDIASRIQQLSADGNVEIILLRNDDEFIEITDRVERIERLQPDLVVVLHANGHSDESQRGTEIYVCPKNPFFDESRTVASRMLSHVAQSPLESRGVKTSHFTVLKSVRCPAIHLEVGFLTHQGDREYLVSEEGQDAIARNFVAALQE